MRKTIIPIPNDELSIFEKKAIEYILCIYCRSDDGEALKHCELGTIFNFQIVRLLFGLNESKST